MRGMPGAANLLRSESIAVDRSYCSPYHPSVSKAKPRRSRPVQGELPLLKGTRGGWRPGAGRKAGPRPRVRHRSREGFSGARPCLVTLKVRTGIASLRRPDVVREVEDAFRRGRARAGRERFRLAHYSIQGNHLHAIVEAEGTDALGRGMMSVAIRFARAVNRALGRRGRVLEDRYHGSAHRNSAAREGTFASSRSPSSVRL